MKEYNSVSEPFLADVRAVVGDANVLPSLKSWSNIKPTRNMIRAVSVCLRLLCVLPMPKKLPQL